MQRHWLNKKHDEKELRKLITHELIHYQLGDEGKHYSGHGKEFRRRANVLGCEDVKDGCHHMSYYHDGDEETKYEMTTSPMIRRLVKKPFGEVEKELRDVYWELLKLCQKLDFKIREKIVEKLNQFHITWTCYVHSIKRGDKEFAAESCKRVRGRKPKSLKVLIEEHDQLKEQLKRYEGERSSLTNEEFSKAAILQSRIGELDDVAEKYYGVTL